MADAPGDPVSVARVTEYRRFLSSTFVVPVLIGVGLAVFAIMILVDTGSYTAKFAGGDPGPQIYPRMIAVASLVASAFLIYGVFRKTLATREVTEGKDSGDLSWPLILEIAVVIGCTFLFPHLGFMLTLAVLVGLTALIMGMRTWWHILLLVVVAPLVAWLLFGLLFKLPLPTGPIETLMGI